MNNFFNLLNSKIKKYKKIGLFFHQKPDCDTLGSCFAVKTFINEQYPKKQVCICGFNEFDPNEWNNFFIENKKFDCKKFVDKNTLIIICDCSQIDRVHNNCLIDEKNEVIIIDHHIINKKIDLSWIDSKYSSVCEMIAEMLLNEKVISSESAKYCFVGMVTDTGRFLFPNTTSNTLKIASELINVGVNVKDLYDTLYTRTHNYVLCENELRKYIKYDNNIGYLIVPKEIYNKYKLKKYESFVYLINFDNKIKYCVSIYFDEKNKCWKGSLRSNTKPINKIAEKYNGGGHALAAGFKLDKKEELKEVIKDLKNN